MPTTTPRRRPAPKTTQPAENAIVDGVLHLSRKAPDPFVEREPLFVLDGKTYTIPVRVSASASLHYLSLWLNSPLPTNEAIVWAMRHVLGDEGYAALDSYQQLTPEFLNHVITIVRGKFDGTMKDPKAKRSNG